MTELPELVLTEIRRAARAGSRAAHWTRCRRCHAPVLEGLDADLCALTARTDPLPIDERTELYAILTGRGTFDRWTNADRTELCRREAAHISGTRRTEVVAEHRCGNPLPGIAPKRKGRRTDDAF